MNDLEETFKTLFNALTSQPFLPSHCDVVKKCADQLYVQLRPVVISVIETAPLLEDPTPFMIQLTDAISDSLKLYQTRTTLIRSLCRTYRILIELGWHMVWRNGKQVEEVDPATLEKIAEVCARLFNALKRKKSGAADVWFEVRCIEQAAKFLKPGKGIRDYLVTIRDVALEGVQNNYSDALKILHNLKKDLKELWYIDVHELRWISFAVTTVDEFDKLIGPKVVEFRDKKRKHATCITLVLISIVDDGEVEEDVRDRAFCGGKGDDEPGLKDVLFWDTWKLRKENLTSRIKNKIFRDPWKNARCVCLGYFGRIAKSQEDKYIKYKAVCLETIQKRHAEVKERKWSPEEKMVLEEQLRNKAKIKSELEDERERCEENIDSLNVNFDDRTYRSGDSEDDTAKMIEEAEVLLRKVDQEKETCEEEIERLNLNLEKGPQPEELDLLEKILSGQELEELEE